MDGALLSVYHDEIPGFIWRAASAPALARLADVGMNCGCEYTAFGRFSGIGPYSRLEHSIGVGLITWHFTGDTRQALAALFHDIATPCFAHVVDFLNGDYLTQESTEDGTAAAIAGSSELQAVLAALGLVTDDVSDYHAFPIADNDAPRLSADRLEYTLGNAVNFGLDTTEAVAAMYDDLSVGVNEDGEPELMFRHAEIARRFCECALACSRIYVSDPDRCAMQYLAELLGDAVGAGVIARRELWRTEPEVVARLEASPAFSRRWREFRALNATARAGMGEACPAGEGWRVIPAKRRWINPLAAGMRATARFPEYAAAVEAFLREPIETPVRAFVQSV